MREELTKDKLLECIKAGKREDRISFDFDLPIYQIKLLIKKYGIDVKRRKFDANIQSREFLSFKNKMSKKEIDLLYRGRKYSDNEN